jgi:hypothetical protein
VVVRSVPARGVRGVTPGRSVFEEFVDGNAMRHVELVIIFIDRSLQSLILHLTRLRGVRRIIWPVSLSTANCPLKCLVHRTPIGHVVIVVAVGRCGSAPVRDEAVCVTVDTVYVL